MPANTPTPYEWSGASGLPADPECRSAFVAYIEWGTRLAVASSQPDADPVADAPMSRWGRRDAPPHVP